MKVTLKKYSWQKFHKLSKMLTGVLMEGKMICFQREEACCHGNEEQHDRQGDTD